MITIEIVTKLINQLLPEPQAGLLAGILLGVKVNMTTDLYNALITTGTLHIVALSGANISILSGLVSDTLLGLFRISRRIVGVLTLCIIIGFVAFVGLSPSVVRAALMGFLATLGMLSGRQIWPFWFWAITVCVMLAFSPQLVTDISFQLSAGATLGIILYGQKKPNNIWTWTYQKNNSVFRLLSTVITIIGNDLRVTLAAQVFTIPIILFHFHRISLISPLPNLLIGWIIPPLTGAGYLTVIAGIIWQPLGQIMAWFIYLPLTYVVKVVEITSQLPFASVGF